MKFMLVLGAIGIIIIAIALANLKSCQNLYFCSEAEEFKSQTFSGKVIKKYLDLENHNFRTIVISGMRDLVLSNDTSMLYSSVLEDDSIIKIKNKDFVRVKRANEIHDYVLTFNCKIK